MKKAPVTGDPCKLTPGCGGVLHVGCAQRYPGGPDEHLAWCDTCGATYQWNEPAPEPEKPKKTPNHTDR